MKRRIMSFVAMLLLCCVCTTTVYASDYASQWSTFPVQKRGGSSNTYYGTIALQTILRMLYNYDDNTMPRFYRDTIDGSFGGNTERAVEDFQAYQGLSVDGSCGPQTWRRLYSMLVANSTSNSQIVYGTIDFRYNSLIKVVEGTSCVWMVSYDGTWHTFATRSN